MTKIPGRLSMILLLFMTHVLDAQDPVVIVFSGTLASVNTVISNRKCDIEFFMQDGAGEPLLLRKVKVNTDSSGRFAFFIKDMPVVFKNGVRSPSVKMTLHIQPVEKLAEFKEEGLYVEYTMFKNGMTGYEMKRWDDQELKTFNQQHLWTFSDEYPFALLTGNFYISFSGHLTDVDQIYRNGRLLQQQSSPGVGAAPVPQRGIKGGYAVGGYKKKK